MADTRALVCATRAIKNAKHLQRVVPNLMPKDEPAEGFGSILPLTALASLHRADRDAKLTGPFAGVAFPRLLTAGFKPLFSGTLFFVRVFFTVQNQNNAVISVSAADMTTALQYASRAVVPISEYASQYGPNSISVNSKILSFSVTLPGNTYNDAQLQTFVNMIASQQKLPSSACVVILNPLGIVNTSGSLSNGVGGYHSKANVTYIFVNVAGQNLAISDPPFDYAGSVSHEIAEMVVDPQADVSNPEVCDPCGPNCVSTFLDYFDPSGTYIATSQQFPPPFPYAFFINGIVQPSSSSVCSATIAASACSYAPISLVGSDHFYTTSLDERDNAINNLGYQAEGVACFAFPSNAPGAVPLHRLFNATTSDHFYTISDSERDNAVAKFGYKTEGEACFVRSAATAAQAAPLHRLFRPTGDHFYTLSDAERDNAVGNLGYQSEGESCFVSAADPSNVSPFYRMFRPTGDHFYTMSLTERDDAIASGYRNEEVACFAFTSQTAGTNPLHRLFNPTSGDHFYTTSDTERNNAIAKSGYKSEGEACFVFTSAAAGRVPLHRLFNPKSGDHFYTTSDAERNNAVSNLGYQNEGEACFIFAADPAAITPLYRLYHPFL
jgi:hypothetical protein